MPIDLMGMCLEPAALLHPRNHGDERHHHYPAEDKPFLIRRRHADINVMVEYHLAATLMAFGLTMILPAMLRS